MLRHVVSDQTFFNILSAYRAAFACGAATTADFQNVCSNVYGADLAWFFNEWIYGPGAPAYQYGSQTVTVAGQPYLLLYLNQTQNSSYGTFTMPVDVRIEMGGSPSQTVTVWNNVDPQWYVIPVRQTPTQTSISIRRTWPAVCKGPTWRSRCRAAHFSTSTPTATWTCTMRRLSWMCSVRKPSGSPPRR